MAPKRQQLTPPRPPPFASSTSSEEDEDDSSSSEIQQQQQQQQLKQQQPISTPVSSQIPKKPTSKTLVSKPASSSTSNDDDDDDDDEDGGGGEEDDGDDDFEDEAEKSKFKISQPISKNTSTTHNNNTNSKAKTKPIPNQQQKHQSDNDEDDDDEDETGDADDDDDDAASDPDLPPNKASRADPSIKPISSKPMDASASKSLKSPPPSKSSPASPPPKSSVQKRLVPHPADSNGKDPKKRQKAVHAAPDDDDDPATKKQLFQRVWTEDDEIAILKGLVEFSKGGSSSSLDLRAFHDSIKGSFKSDLSKRQVSEKIRRLKNKFQNIAQKEKMGKEPTIAKDHERLLYQLSKKIWGKDEDAASNKKHPIANANRTRKAAEDAVEPKSPAGSKPSAAIPHDSPAEDHTAIDDSVRKLETLYPNLSDALSSGGINGVLGLGESHVRRVLELMDHSQVKEWDQRWMDLQARERALCMERATLVYEMVNHCYKAIKSSTK